MSRATDTVTSAGHFELTMTHAAGKYWVTIRSNKTGKSSMQGPFDTVAIANLTITTFVEAINASIGN